MWNQMIPIFDIIYSRSQQVVNLLATKEFVSQLLHRDRKQSMNLLCSCVFRKARPEEMNYSLVRGTIIETSRMRIYFGNRVGFLNALCAIYLLFTRDSSITIRSYVNTSITKSKSFLWVRIRHCLTWRNFVMHHHHQRNVCVDTSCILLGQMPIFANLHEVPCTPDY